MAVETQTRWVVPTGLSCDVETYVSRNGLICIVQGSDSVEVNKREAADLIAALTRRSRSVRRL